MTILKRVLETPRYGYESNGEFYRPSRTEIFNEFFWRLNIFRSKKNWLSVLSWIVTLGLTAPFFIFFIYYWNWKLAVAGFLYSMVALGSHGTFWLHRYSTHRAFTFKNRFWREICRNLVIKIIPEEVYVVSHHVHHRFSEQPGDPYNVNGGWLYCFLADVNHQGIRRNLSERDYLLTCSMLNHTGVHSNSYSQYQRWGTICHPAITCLHYLLNWMFWYGVFFLLGGNALATALLGFSGVWAVGIRTFNFEGHGRGRDRKRQGSDFNQKDNSINQLWPGFVAGEWHNNHHLFPSGARSGFLFYQLDLPWILIKSLHKVGAISSFRDFKSEFFENHYLPFKTQKAQPRTIAENHLV